MDLWLRKVRVTEQLVRLQTGEWVREEPKTSASVRSVTISPVVAGLLEAQPTSSPGPAGKGLVFPNGKGNRLVSSSFWSNHFARLWPALSWLAEFMISATPV